MTVKALLFDMDGTIVDNISYHHDAWITFLGRHHVPLQPDQFHAQNHGTIEEMISRFFGNDLPGEKIRELGAEKEQTYRDLYRESVKEVNGLTALLEWASAKGLKIGLSTMGNTENIDFILDNLSIRSYFDAIVGGDQVSKGKPDPEIFIRTLENLDVLPGEAVVFEDSQGGITAAESAGAKIIGLSTTHTAEELMTWGASVCLPDFTLAIEALEHLQKE